jgi:hypothetical protein
MKAILRELVQDSTNKIDLYQAPRNAIYELHKNPCTDRSCNRSLNVAVIAAPCHGLGDVIFATKFARYLKYGLTPRSQPYSRRVSIITPTAKMFEQLGVKDIKIVPLSSGNAQCRRLRHYKRPANLGTLDLIFIAPLMRDFDIQYPDVHGFLKESTPFNTIILSEYQDDPERGFDFATGVGDDYSGLLFDGSKPSPKLKAIGTTPYAVAYLTQDVGIQGCLSNFVKMIVSKYHKKYSNLQVVMPEWGVKKLSHNRVFKQFVKKYYPNLIVKTKNDEKQLLSSDKNTQTLTLRGDIFSLSRPDMLSLIKHSIPDILVTGDQSITDVIDCCQRKNIWYQTVPWKRDLAKALAKELPQRYLSSANTSCGTLKAIRWNSKGTAFKSRHDFRKKAKHELDVIFRAASEARRKNSVIHKYLAQLNKSASKPALLSLLD